MNTVESIEEAVADLPPTDLAKFRSWFVEFDSASWDAQIEADATSSKLDALAAEALTEYQSGKAREL